MTEKQLPEPGAPSALKAIAEEEAVARAHRDECREVYLNACRDATTRPMEKDGTDWDRLEAVAKRHLDDAEVALEKLRKLLLSYDSKVAPEKRDSTEKITREEAESLFQMVAVYERQATMSFIHTVAGNVLACKTPEEVYQMTEGKLKECKRNAVESAIREKHLPQWVGKSLEGLI